MADSKKTAAKNGKGSDSAAAAAAATTSTADAISASQTQLRPEGAVCWVKWGQSWWPARIARLDEVAPAVKNEKKSNDYLVYFFGDGSHAWVKANQVFDWEENKDLRKKSNKSKKMDKSVEDTDEWAAAFKAGEHTFPKWTPESSTTAASKKASKAAEKKKKPKVKAKSMYDTSSDEEAELDESNPENPKKRKRVIDPDAVRRPDEEPGIAVKRRKFAALGDADKKKSLERRRSRQKVMRRLGLWPPKGSSWTLSSHGEPDEH